MKDNKRISVVLAGQGNTGKTSIFNYYTGSHQHTGNWAGKTIEKLEGTLYYKDYTIDVLDLPGIYSLTTLSVEELIAREYIIKHKPDVVINIVDATNLERNLIFTLQLLELECPLIIALNMVDIAKKKGIEIDTGKLQEKFNAPVIPTIAKRGTGLTELMDKVIEVKENGHEPGMIRYGREIESCVDELSAELKNTGLLYSERWIAIKLLEKDSEITNTISQIRPELIRRKETLEKRLEEIHGHDSSLVISDERSHYAAQIVSETAIMRPHRKLSLSDRLDIITTHKFAGYLVMILIVGGMFLTVFKLGNWLSSVLETVFSSWHNWWIASVGETFLASLSWSAIEGVLALVEIALPYILPFYIILYILEEWGYIARISFLMDNLMHKIGIHGKGCISFIIGLGCNVPGCLSCRIMESRRERFLTAVLVTLVPCSAVSVIVFGLVGKYVGLIWAFGLYVFAMVIIFIAGKILSKLLPGEPVELIMPMPDYKKPHLKAILYQTWDALKEFIYIAAPIVIIAGVVIQAINLAGWMPAISRFMSPVTVNWLGLPAITGILLIFGILRKELILVMLAAYLGTTEFAEVLTPVQMITLAVVSMFYVPCIATVSVLWKEYGWKRALAVTLIEILFAILLAGLVYRLLSLFDL
ncbi:MAG TPA: ferrous iron transport protein B [Bacteroidales bacterium]|jgi:ferrous iron transport protein B|nr:ferrous iron transport protein B [Bacteroidales bacterium]HQH23207.1 ferrous iron transport protein B [Bacteroidales bacterium]HQJ80935.1 ferrous iron transport protein B [Bacteroidales bacterium]